MIILFANNSQLDTGQETRRMLSCDTINQAVSHTHSPGQDPQSVIEGPKF